MLRESGLTKSDEVATPFQTIEWIEIFLGWNIERHAIPKRKIRKVVANLRSACAERNIQRDPETESKKLEIAFSFRHLIYASLSPTVHHLIKRELDVDELTPCYMTVVIRERQCLHREDNWRARAKLETPLLAAYAGEKFESVLAFWKYGSMDSVRTGADETCSVCVAVNIRPLIASELSEGCQKCVSSSTIPPQVCLHHSTVHVS